MGSAFGPDYFTGPANPMDLTTATDAARAVRFRLTSEGGTVSATGADGTTFTLEVPKDAVVDDIDITLTPVTTIVGWDVPPDGSVAVQMEPDGLTFLTPARLTIIPTAAIGDAPGSPFAFHADGKDAHLAPRDPNAPEIVVLVEHFSGRGFIWSVGESFWDSWSRHKQNEVEDRLRNRIALELGLQRDFERMGWTDETDPTLEQIYESIRAEYERDVLNARLLLVSKSCADALRAVNLFIAWNRHMELLGLDRLKIDPPRKLRLTARYVCAEENTQLCFQTGDLARLVSELFSDERLNELLGEGLPHDLGAYAKACGQYDLEIEQHSEALLNLDGVDVKLKADLEITIPLRWVASSHPTGLDGNLEGEAIGQVVDGGGAIEQCTITFKAGPGDKPYKAKITSLQFIRTGVHQDTIRFEDLDLEFTRGHAAVPASVKCPSIPAYPLPPVDLPFVFNDAPMLTIKGWTGEGHPTIATKDNDQVMDGTIKGIDNLHFELVHKPGAMPARPEIP